MRLSQLRSSLLSCLAISLIRPSSAGLIPDLLDGLSSLHSSLEKRCDKPCGYYGQLCCASNEYCYTDASGQAQCGADSNNAITTATVYATAAATTQQGGNYQVFTTTYTQTDYKTVVMTYTSFIPNQVATSAAQPSCSYAQGQSVCGTTCCLSGQYCSNGMCVAVPGSSGYYSSLLTVTTTLTNTASAPLRPTTNTILTLTNTASSVVPFQTPTPASTTGAILTGNMTSSGGLSGGAIAGIVIGVIAGIILLLLICACCCAKGLIDGLLSIFGLGKRRTRTEEVEVIEERRHHSGRNSTANAAAAGGAAGFASRWFGQGPKRRTEYIDEKKKRSSGLGTIAGVGAFLGGLALLLGLKRRNDERKEGSVGSSYYYYDDESYSASSASSGRGARTRDSRSRSRSRR